MFFVSLSTSDTPSAPSIESVEPYSSTAQIHFDEPEATGGVPILRYKAEWRAMSENDWHARLYDAKEGKESSMATVFEHRLDTTLCKFWAWDCPVGGSLWLVLGRSFLSVA